MAEINLVGGSYVPLSASIDAQRTINFYVEADPTQAGKGVAALIRTPGLKLFGVTGLQFGIRPGGLYTTRTDAVDRMFIASGNNLFEAYSNGYLLQRGFFLSSAGPVSMADNGRFLVMVDGRYGYVFDLVSGLFTRITDENFPGADRVTSLDNYLLFNRPNTQQFFWSNLTDVTFDALDFTAVDGFPDRLVAVLAYRRELWLFGATTTERWYNAGDALFPFQRIQGGFSEEGLAAAHSLAVIGDKLCWFTANQEGAGMVYVVLAGQTQRVSTHAVEHAWQHYPRLDDALGWGEQRDGHEFYWLTFPTGNATWVLDLTTGLWHERAYLNPATGAWERHRAQAATYAFGRHFVGDYANGNVYDLDAQTYTDNGAPLRAVRRVPYVFAGNTPANLPWVHHYVLQIDAQMGVGLSTGQGSVPQLVLRWSDDGGVSWVEERAAPLGKMGERRSRAVFRRLGRSRARVYEVAVSDPVPVTLLGAYLEVEVATV